eukprot:scaffold516_cov175-Amphora_coffeaeformis.AAC.47
MVLISRRTFQSLTMATGKLTYVLMKGMTSAPDLGAVTCKYIAKESTRTLSSTALERIYPIRFNPRRSLSR